MKQSDKFLFQQEVPIELVGQGVSRQILGYNEDVMMVKVIFETGSIGAVHDHPHVQTTYVESGVFEVEIDGERKTLAAGDAFLVPSGQKHGVVCLQAGVLVDVFTPMRQDFLAVR